MRRFQQPRLQTRKNRTETVWWAEWWEYERQPDGTEKRVHRSQVLGDAETMGRTAARARAAALGASQAASTSATWTVRRWVEEVWLPKRLAKWSRKSRRTSLSEIHRHILPYMGNADVAEVRRYNIEAHLSLMRSHGLGRQTLIKVRSLYRSIFDDLEENELINRNPARRAELPPTPASERTQPYTEAEAQALCSVPGMNGLILRVLILTGIRPGELLALRRDDLRDGLLIVDESTDQAGCYKETKTRRTRAIYMSPDTVLRRELEALAAGLPSDAILFDCVATVNGLERRLKAATQDVVSGFRMRRCRATAANLIDLSETDRRDLLGHTDVEMTRAHYLVANRQTQAAAVAELERRLVGRAETGRTQ